MNRYKNSFPQIRSRVGKFLGYDRVVRDLERRVRELQWDATFEMWNRSAFLQFCSLMPRGTRVLAFLDLDDIHGLNHRLGYSEVDRRIRETFSIPLRVSDLVARWYSGDEIVLLFDSNEAGARGKIEELVASASRHGLGFVWDLGIWNVGAEDVSNVINAIAGCTRIPSER